jgi:hypothetical protein
VALRLKVRVSKGNPTVEGGGRVVVSLGGQPVDTLPFYLDPADDDITFYKSYEFPMTLNAGPRPLLRAVIEPDRLVTDPDLANNTISVPMDIQPPTLPDEGTDSAARIVSLSVHSEFGDGVAKAGANLTLRAQVAGGGGRTRITYEVNSAVMFGCHDLESHAPCGSRPSLTLSGRTGTVVEASSVPPRPAGNAMWHRMWSAPPCRAPSGTRITRWRPFTACSTSRFSPPLKTGC